MNKTQEKIDNDTVAYDLIKKWESNFNYICVDNSERSILHHLITDALKDKDKEILELKTNN